MKKYRDNDPERIIEKEEKYSEEYYFRVLNKERYILLYDAITEVAADLLVTKIKAMATLDKTKPITIEIDSPGGSVPDGMAIINAILSCPCKIITIISGQACSMAALISICGDEKYIYENSYWMQHSTSDIVGDYIQYIKDRTKFLLEFEKRTEVLLKNKTKLSKMDIHKIRSGELWLDADEALRKGIVDNIIRFKARKK
jgi:ATP-dependent Clp protease protease subunit